MTEKCSVNNANSCKFTSAPLFGFRPEKISDVQNKSFMQTTQRNYLSVAPVPDVPTKPEHLLCVMSLSQYLGPGGTWWDLVGGNSSLT